MNSRDAWSPIATDRSGRRRVLLVDRPDAERAAAAAALRAQGYEVVVAEAGVDALAHSLAGHLDVVILNVGLPGLGGAEAAAVLKWLDPTVQVILTADPNGVPPAGERRHVERFRCFAKPLDLAAITRAVAETAVPLDLGDEVAPDPRDEVAPDPRDEEADQ
jgi:DNA-binding NtrC family response regulator